MKVTIRIDVVHEMDDEETEIWLNLSAEEKKLGQRRLIEDVIKELDGVFHGDQIRIRLKVEDGSVLQGGENEKC